MLIMDSGLGGISVVRAIRHARPTVPITYVADTAWFPYGARSAESLTERAFSLITSLQQQQPLPMAVLACNTLSTLALTALRSRLPFPIVGTVPAVKTAARFSKTRRFTLLATPNTAQSAYSQALIAEFASGCVVDCYGAPGLARMAESALLGSPPDARCLAAEIAPAFYDDARGRTDAIVLGCTHYPLLAAQLVTASRWPVAWIDSSDAIARRSLTLWDTTASPSSSCSNIAHVTTLADAERYRDFFLCEGFTEVRGL